MFSLEEEQQSWTEKFILTILSYGLILVPIWLTVLATRYEIFPEFIRESEFIKWFVEGYEYEITITPDQIESGIKAEKQVNSEKLVAEELDKPKRPFSFWNFAWCFFGLQFSYLLWGLLQERVMTTRYEVKSWESWLNGEKRMFTLTANANRVSTYSSSSLISSSVLEGSLNYGPAENIETITFGDSQFLVFVNRVVAFILSMIVILGEHFFNRQTQDVEELEGKGKAPIELDAKDLSRQAIESEKRKPTAPFYEYIYCSLSNVLSSWCQYEALKYVSFPTQALSKTCKVIPVMLISSLVLHKKYPLADYVCAATLTVGLFMFILFQPSDGEVSPVVVNLNNLTKSDILNANEDVSVQTLSVAGADKSDFANNIWDSPLANGLIILALYLTFDSFTSNWQQSLFTRYSVTNWQMMGATSIYSILLTLTSLQQLGSLRPAIEMLSASPDLLLDCLLTSVTSSVGQLFVFITIKQFGSVAFVVIMTLRQLFAILLSCVVYGHALSLGSSAGLAFVFSAVAYQVWRKSQKTSSPKPLTLESKEENKIIAKGTE